MRALLLLLLLLLGCGVAAGRQFRDLTLQELSERATELQGPFASVRSADELWGRDELRSKDCTAQVIRVTTVDDLREPPATPPHFLKSLPQLDHPLPQVVISGEIHGNERVGPSSSLFTSQLLVWSAMCAIKDSKSHCERLQQDLLITDQEITWLAFLATKRDTFVLPAANCRGYVRNVRVDEGVDTNRDFSYSRTDNRCLMSTTAKVFNALFSTVSVQILVTFHGGMVALGYEWGSVDHPRGKDLCPDHNAHKDIAESMAKYGGTFKHAKAYRAKPINSIVYAVEGGMEDWAYAAGWDTDRVRGDCQGYKALPVTQLAVVDEKRKFAIPNNRAVTFLVETSDRKTPRVDELGVDKNVLVDDVLSNEKYGGHIPRNTRLSLAAIDMVEPYLCFAPRKPSPESKGGDLSVQWYVGGAHIVDKTWLSWHRTVPSPDGHEIDHSIPASDVLHGKARWSLARPVKDVFSGNYKLDGSFTATVRPPPADIVGNENIVWLVAHAVVDQNWASSGQGFPKSSPPQSHLVQIRTNSSYRASSYTGFNSKDIRLKGQKEWLSDAIEVEVFPPSRHERHLRQRKGKGLRDMFGKDNRGSLRVRSMVEHCAWWSRK